MFSLCSRSLVRQCAGSPAFLRRLPSFAPSRRSLPASELAAEKADSRLRHQSTFPTDFAVAKTQLLTSLKDIKLADMKLAPTPIFWSGVAGLAPIVLPPLSFILLGYSPALGLMQMTFAATISSFLSGIKYGTHVAHQETATWDNVLSSIGPQFLSFGGLLLPTVLGFPLIMTCIAYNGFIDLTSGNYPPWYKAMRLGLTVPVVLSLFLTCFFNMFD